MATATNAEIFEVDMEQYSSDPVYRAIMNMIHIPPEIEEVDKDDYTDFLFNKFFISVQILQKDHILNLNLK